MQQHWERMHTSRPPDRTGWWEETPATSLALIERCALRPEDCIVDAGSGASTLAGALLARGHTDLVAADISASALATLRGRLDESERAHLRCVVDDLAHPSAVLALHDVALWHDRAALHFLTDPADREQYAAAVRVVVRPGGFVILGAFAIGGAEECSDLPVRQYNAALFGALLGPEFVLLDEQRSCTSTWTATRGRTSTRASSARAAPSGDPRGGRGMTRGMSTAAGACHGACLDALRSASGLAPSGGRDVVGGV